VAAEKVKPLAVEYWSLWNRQIWRMPEGGRVVSLQTVREGTSVELAPRGAGAWAMHKPVEAPADSEQITKLLGQLRLFRADGIAAFPAVPENLANAKDQAVIRLGVEVPFPTTMPSLAAGAMPKELKVFTFHVVKVDGKVRAWMEGQPVTPVGEFSESFYADVTGELRDRTLAKIAPETIKQIRLVNGPDVTEYVTELARTEAGWRYTAGKYVDIDADKVREFLQDFAALKAERFAAYTDPGTLGLAQGQRRVELTDAKGQVVTMSLSDQGPAAGGRYAALSGVQGVAVLSAADGTKLDKTWKDFKKADKADKPEMPPMPMPGMMPQ
ncbi:MAG: DUF4340 domain-containing protein, partial [Planctomycetota bacterium]|nr:DUF4340 domain-containing protein [Planctomycetota bacterium]